MVVPVVMAMAMIVVVVMAMVIIVVMVVNALPRARTAGVFAENEGLDGHGHGI